MGTHKRTPVVVSSGIPAVMSRAVQKGTYWRMRRVIVGSTCSAVLGATLSLTSGGMCRWTQTGTCGRICTAILEAICRAC